MPHLIVHSRYCIRKPNERHRGHACLVKVGPLGSGFFIFTDYMRGPVRLQQLGLLSERKLYGETTRARSIWPPSSHTKLLRFRNGGRILKQYGDAYQKYPHWKHERNPHNDSNA
jgi:hypothetical protein